MSPLRNITDLAYLRELSGGDETFVRQTVEIFLKEVQLETAKLENAIKCRDYNLIAFSAHKLRSMVLYVGLTDDIGKEISEMERMANIKHGILKIDALFHKVKAICLLASEELKLNLTDYSGDSAGI